MYQEYTLENGLTILMLPVQVFQSVSVGIFVKVGSRYESADQAGTSHFIEHMLFKGTPRRPSAKLIAEAIESIGGVSNAYTSQDLTAYYAKVAASQATTAIDVLTDMIRHPLFEADQIEKERQVIGEEINMTYDDPDSRVSILLDEVIWPDHPLGHDVAGSHESLAGINQQGLREFYRAAYHPQNLLVAVSGAFETEEVVRQIAERLGDWSPGSKPTFAAAPPRQTEARWRVEDRAIEQGHLCLALSALSRSHPDRYALSVLNAILGEGMSSRLFLNIREERGLAYAVDSGLNLLHDTGSMVIYAGVDPDRAPEALEAILTELARLRDEPVPPAELHKAKEFLKGRLVLGLEDSFSQASWVATQKLLMDRVKLPAEVLQAYEAVTAAEVQAIAQKLLIPTAYNLAAVGPFGEGEPFGRLLTGN
jgi:predicted Zn-dependent peptidase